MSSEIIENIEQQARAEARAWARATKAQLLFKLASLSLEQKGALIRSLRNRVNSRRGQLHSISYNFIRHGVFLEKGVGKETPIEKVGTTARKAKPWFNPVVTDNIDDLADRLFFIYDKELSNNFLIQ